MGSEWLDIDTAPMDGTYIMLGNETSVSEGGWMSDIDCGAEWEGQIGMAGWWRLDDSGGPPTHWMPLPAAPSASPAEAPAEDAEACELVPSEILGRFPEINPSNYDHDDVCALNAWGIELVKAAHPQPVAPAGQADDWCVKCHVHGHQAANCEAPAGQAAAGVQGEKCCVCGRYEPCETCGGKNPAPAVERGVAEEREQLRAEQAAAVMPLIGPLLDAWDGLPNDEKAAIREESSALARAIADISRGMDGLPALSTAGKEQA